MNREGQTASSNKSEKEQNRGFTHVNNAQASTHSLLNITHDPFFCRSFAKSKVSNSFEYVCKQI